MKYPHTETWPETNVVFRSNNANLENLRRRQGASSGPIPGPPPASVPPVWRSRLIATTGARIGSRMLAADTASTYRPGWSYPGRALKILLYSSVHVVVRLPAIVPVESLGTDVTISSGNVPNSAGCRYNAGISLYSAHTSTIEGSLPYT